MNKKNIIIVVCLLGISVIACMIWTAQKARNKSDQILDEFQKINRSLDSANGSLQKKKDSSDLPIKK